MNSFTKESEQYKIESNNKNHMKIYELGLFEKYAPDHNSMIIRVPGGWIYYDIQGQCFIPFDYEFKNKKMESE